MSFLSKNQLKYYSSLQQKRYRYQSGRFLVEGEKMIREFLELDEPGLKAVKLLALPEFLSDNQQFQKCVECVEISERDLKKISSLKTPNKAVLELEIPEITFRFENIQDKFSVFLEDIRDPGNLGTIMRTADWFGIDTILISPESVDPYNPKVIQSSMGSFARLRVYEVAAADLIEDAKKCRDFTISGTSMEGDNLYDASLSEKGIIFFGNESRGLSDFLINACNPVLRIPGNRAKTGPESLNLGVSVAIVLSEFSRRFIQNEN